MLKLISVNIEQDKHHDTVLLFLKAEAPDVVCMQEVFQKDLILYENALGMKSFFKPMCYFKSSIRQNHELIGSAILYRDGQDFGFEYVVGSENNMQEFRAAEDKYKERNLTNIVLLWGDIRDANGDLYKIVNTHFTWTPEGLSTEYQREDAMKAISILESRVKDFVFTGDLNSVRGRETFALFAEKWKDNIPANYDSSIDPEKHRVKGLRYMVDGLFTTVKYRAKDVKLIEGVSDHKAIVGYIEKI